MKHLLSLLLCAVVTIAFGQVTDAAQTSAINTYIRNITAPSGITKGAVSDRFQDVVNSKASRAEVIVASGTNNYSATGNSSLTYSQNFTVRVKFTNANTTLVTLNINGLGAKSVKKSVSTDLASGDILAGEIRDLTYDGTNFQLSGSSGGGAAHIIENAGAPLTARANLNFSNGLTASDNDPDTDVKLGGELTETETHIYPAVDDTQALFIGQNVAEDKNIAYIYLYSASQVSIQNTNSLAYYVANTNGITLSGGSGYAKVADTRGSPQGLEYLADYSATYSSRSLVDKGYVTSAITAGVGNPWLLGSGGALTANNTISGSFGFSMGITGNIAIQSVSGADVAGVSLARSAGASNASIYAESATQTTGILLGLTAGTFRITDGRTSPTGIEYFADYSAGYTSRSLVDKGYVTSAVGNPWQLASGGTFTAANTLAMAGFNVSFLDGNILSGPTGATITASTRMDVRGVSGGNAVRVASDANAPLFTMLNDGHNQIGSQSNVFLAALGANVTLDVTGQNLLFNSNGGTTQNGDAFVFNITNALASANTGSQTFLRIRSFTFTRANTNGASYGIQATTNYSQTGTSTGEYASILYTNQWTNQRGKTYGIVFRSASNDWGSASSSSATSYVGFSNETVFNQLTGTGAVTIYESVPTATLIAGTFAGFKHAPTVTSITGTHYAFWSTSGKLASGTSTVTNTHHAFTNQSVSTNIAEFRNDSDVSKFTLSNLGNSVFAQSVSTTGSPTGILFTGAAHTTLTASVEATDVEFNLARTVQFSTGALTNQRAVRVRPPDYAFVGSSTLSFAAGVEIQYPPRANTNATITETAGLYIGTADVSNGGTVTTAYGLLVLAPSGATNNYSANFDLGVLLTASTTALAPLRIPHGTAPSSPVNGDIWTTTTSVFAQVNGATVDLASGGSGLTFQQVLAVVTLN